MLKSGERQVATRREDVREDHTARYDWAAKTLPPNSFVIDLGCGIGYGAEILADAGHTVFAIDADEETIAFARETFAHERIEYVAGRADAIYLPKADAAVCFEMIEHVADPAPMLAKLCEAAPILLASVPNEDAFPWKPEYSFHHRHYTFSQFRDLLCGAGFGLKWVGGQLNAQSPVQADGVTGRTIVVEAVAAEATAMTEAGWNRIRNQQAAEKLAAPAVVAPEPEGIGHVVILGLGPSAEQYMDLCKRLGGRRKFADQVWAINSHGRRGPMRPRLPHGRHQGPRASRRGRAEQQHRRDGEVAEDEPGPGHHQPGASRLSGPARVSAAGRDQQPGHGLL